jgi:hypothetical protein
MTISRAPMPAATRRPTSATGTEYQFCRIVTSAFVSTRGEACSDASNSSNGSSRKVRLSSRSASPTVSAQPTIRRSRLQKARKVESRSDEGGAKSGRRSGANSDRRTQCERLSSVPADACPG